MKIFVLMLFLSYSVVYAEPKNNVDNSQKLCLETIYKNNFEAAPDSMLEKLNHLLSKCIAETKIKDFTLIKCSCSQPENIDPCIDKFISSHNFTKNEYFHAVAYHCERMLWSGLLGR